MYSDDPIADFHAWDRMQAEARKKLPVCDCCGEPIEDDHFYLINGESICEPCLNINFRQYIEDYI